MKTLRVEADRLYLQEVLDFVEGEFGKNPLCTRKDILQLHMVVDEIFGNIAAYAYDGGGGDVEVSVDCDDNDAMLILSFADSGKPYNPLLNQDPDVTLPVRERKVGGLGIFMVKNTMDEIHYENTEGKNRLIMKKCMQTARKGLNNERKQQEGT